MRRVRMIARFLDFQTSRNSGKSGIYSHLSGMACALGTCDLACSVRLHTFASPAVRCGIELLRSVTVPCSAVRGI